MTALKFVPFTSTVESPFWVQYCQLKLETIRLSEDPMELVASYAVASNRLQLVESSLQTPTVANERVACRGTLLGFNTLQGFSEAKKNQLLQQHCLKDPSVPTFLLLVHADLKQHRVLHWFGFPALLTKSPIRATALDLPEVLSKYPDFETIPQSFHTFRQQKSSLSPYFVVHSGTMEWKSWSPSDPVPADSFLVVLDTTFSEGVPSSESKDAPIMVGWPMRTLIAHLAFHTTSAGTTVPILCWRSPLRRLDPSRKDQPIATLGGVQLYEKKELILLQVDIPSPADYTPEATLQKAPVVGWELNLQKNKPLPKWVDLKPLLDSRHLAIQAADLNLQLMKWRMIPSLDVELLRSTKVLLLGAGTLGCSVARTLLAWGIRSMTLLDYGTVSYSNPVRQNLFTLQDCEVAAPKAQAAVDALNQVAADVQAKAVRASIPMPGHSEKQEVLFQSVEQLDALVQDCDVVFVLTDTRESRWLPTVMAAAHDKLCINAALGLDSWLVMRHGSSSSSDGRLGCYFCNDVVAPENSTKNRTLDQQCTVTRPGLAHIAASMAVEMMVSLLHHPKKLEAPAPKVSTSYNPTTSGQEDESSALGVVPHQIRGSLVSFQMMTPTVPAFKCCTGCSPSLVQAYKENKQGVVYQVCQSMDSSYLEDLTGLTAFRADAAEKLAAMEDWDDDIDEEDT
eukprot:Nitzschia sp. Nitz4//scaffold366_size23882//18231//20270//NITZ4_008443-RA/size23882-processed-gene-0.33-mRNA-1//-1//CDS//3329549314//7568//frame0